MTHMSSLVRRSVVVCCGVSVLRQQKFKILFQRKCFFMKVTDYIRLKKEKMFIYRRYSNYHRLNEGSYSFAWPRERFFWKQGRRHLLNSKPFTSNSTNLFLLNIIFPHSDNCICFIRYENIRVWRHTVHLLIHDVKKQNWLHMNKTTVKHRDNFTFTILSLKGGRHLLCWVSSRELALITGSAEVSYFQGTRQSM
jgi:hypothetical protein